MGTRQGIRGKAVEHSSWLPTSHGLVPLADGYELIATHWGVTWVNRISISADVTARPLYQVCTSFCSSCTSLLCADV